MKITIEGDIGKEDNVNIEGIEEKNVSEVEGIVKQMFGNNTHFSAIFDKD